MEEEKQVEEPKTPEEHAKIVRLSRAECLFGQPKQKTARMGIGVHNGIFYYGTIGESADGYPISTIITSDRDCYVKDKNTDEIKEVFGLSVRNEFDESSLEYSWSNESILKYLNNQNPKPQPKELFEDIKSINKEYLDHVNEHIHSFVALDIMCTYIYPLFPTKAITFFCAESGSGKSKQTEIYRRLAFNTMWVSGGTESSIFRSVQSTGGTMLIDNFDDLPDDVKKTIHHYLEVCFNKNGKYRRSSERKGKWKVDVFGVYSPVVVNNIIGMPDITESRAITINMIKTASGVGDTWPSDEDLRWVKLRDNCRFWVLENFNEIQVIYQELQKTKIPGLTNRQRELALPTLTIAKLINEELYQEMVSYLVDNFTSKTQTMQLEYDELYLALEYSKIELESKGKQEISIPIKAMSEHIVGLKGIRSLGYNDTLNPEYHRELQAVSRRLGKRLSTIPIFKAKRLGSGVQYVMSVKSIEQYYKTKGWILPTQTTLDLQTTLDTQSSLTTSSSSITLPSSSSLNKNNLVSE